MEQIREITEALKYLLKMRGLSYAELGKSIGLSESSMKRLFSKGTFTLERLVEICEVLEVGFPELVGLMKKGAAKPPRQLSLDQELELASSASLFAVFYLASRQWKAADIARRLGMSPTELTRALTRLDRLGIIDLNPGNRYVFKVSRDFRMRRDGPLEEVFLTKVRNDFLNAPFSGEDERQLFLVGELAHASWDVVLKRADDLAEDIKRLMATDALLPKSRVRSVGMLVLARPWIFHPLFGK